jgi:hypothetical protein
MTAQCIKKGLFSPGGRVLDRDYQLRKDEAGKIIYSSLGSWGDKELSGKFSPALITARNRGAVPRFGRGRARSSCFQMKSGNMRN